MKAVINNGIHDISIDISDKKSFEIIESLNEYSTEELNDFVNSINVNLNKYLLNLVIFVLMLRIF